MSEKRICGFKSCASGLEPTRQPVVQMSAFGKGSRAQTGELILGLVLCQPCAEKAKPEDFITDEAWAVMQDSFYKLFKRNPMRQSLRVRFQDYISVDTYVEKQKAAQAEQSRKAMEMAKAGQIGIVKQ
jgi:hypothetical protein